MNILNSSTDPTMLTRLREMLESSDRADIAVGYMFLSGFEAVKNELADLREIRILVGRTDGRVLEDVAQGLQDVEALRERVAADELVRRSDRERQADAAAALVGVGTGRLDQTRAQEANVISLRQLIADGVLKVHAYPRARLHAKAYLCWYAGHAERGAAIVGSSNFTLAGFEGNTELNVRVTGDEEMETLRLWFEGLWEDSVDITEAVRQELDRSWVLSTPTPYEIYLRALYELHRDELDAPPLSPRPQNLPELATFQLDAVSRGLRMIDRFGGCFVGDVVGLGKTYIAAELVRQLQFAEPRGRFPLLVCPAGLRPMWERISEAFGLGASVISMSAIRAPRQTVLDPATGLEVGGEESRDGLDLLDTYPNRGVVLVDEAHNFRNPGTKRYRGLNAYLRAGDHKVILVSATPQNLGPADIYHQLRLFLDEFDHGLPLEPLALRDYFKAVQAWHGYRLDLETWQAEVGVWTAAARRGRGPAPARPEPPAEPFASIEQVLAPVFIRRRRRDIRELYGDDVTVAGRRVIFPEPILENLTYSLDHVYAKAGDFESLQSELATHHGARYRALDFLRDDRLDNPQYTDLRRARNRVASLMAHLLFKRLESSVAAFRSTLQVLIDSNRHFAEALGVGFVPVGSVATRLLAGESFDAEEALERLLEEEVRAAEGGRARNLVFPAADFDEDRWLRALDTDRDVLQNVLARVELIGPEDDDKLTALRDLLRRPDVAAGKVLIFSEAATTVDYLYSNLRTLYPTGVAESLSGDDLNRLASVVRRFAPNANRADALGLDGPEISVLFATDVVSEGQNLQDCSRVVNYDLHWNPVRLIQRFGRVDRIGTTHTSIYLHNTWPDLEVDAQLSLTERLRNRIQTFHDFIGLDSQLLDPAERLNVAAMYRIYEEKRLPEQTDTTDEVAAHQRGVALLQGLRDQDPDLWARIVSMPDGLRSARRLPPPPVPAWAPLTQQLALIPGDEQLALDPTAGTALADPARGESVVLLKHGMHVLPHAVGARLASRAISPAQLVAALECKPDEPTRPLPAATNQRVMAAREAAKHEITARLGRARRPTSDTRLRRFVNRGLVAARAAAGDDEASLARIGALQELFGGQLTPDVIADLDDARRYELAGEGLLARLEALRERHRLRPQETTAEDAEEAVLRTIVSLGLVD
jgi:HKD family nuclease